MSFSTTLEELGEIASVASRLVPGTAGTVVHVTSLVLKGAGGIVRELDAAELERIRQSRATGMAAGAAAYEASRNAGPRREP